MNYFQKRVRAFKCAFCGVGRLFAHEAHAKIHLVVAVGVVIAGLLFHISAWQWCAVILCIGGVFMAEAFNSALEKLADRVSPEYNPLIKQAKDFAAAAVLLFALATVAVGLIIFIPYL